MRWKQYYALVKPGIIYGNVLTTLAGFLFACRWRVDFRLLLTTLVGTSLVIAGACVYNNCQDRNIDKRMKRTRQRALVTGAIGLSSALWYASVLTLIGFAILLTVNLTVIVIGLVGFIDYVVLYGYTKRRTPLGTVVGSVSGSTPIIAGYCAVTGHFDVTALLLFIIMTCWQMPHFYAIASYRREEYAAAGVPVLTVTRPAGTVKLRSQFYIAAYLVACLLLALHSRAGYVFAVVMSGLSLAWLFKAVKDYSQTDASWGRGVFGYSLLVLLGFSAVLSVASLLP